MNETIEDIIKCIRHENPPKYYPSQYGGGLVPNSYKKCRHYLPKELGHTANCLKIRSCNYLGRSCALYEKHTAETRKALAEAIEMKQKEKNNVDN